MINKYNVIEANNILEQPKLKDKFTCYWPWIALFIIILSSALIRMHLLDVPFERDEGEYAYAGQLILQGIPPYSEVYNMKLPGIYAAYALIMSVFGQTHSGVHLGLLVINAATIMLIFFVGKKLYDHLAGVTAAAAFAIFSMGQPVQGIFANAEHFVILPAIGGLLLIVNSIDSKKWLSLLTGAVLLGLGFLMKQHGAAFIVFAGLYLFFCEFRRRPLNWKFFIIRCIVFFIGVLIPFAVTCLVLWQSGVFEKFWFWTFDYAREYVSAVPLSAGLNELKKNITLIAGSSFLLSILSFIGLTSLAWNKNVRHNALFAGGFFLFSFLATCPGFYFRPHYFILFLPSAALLAGIGATSLHDLFTRYSPFPAFRAIPAVLVIVILFHSLWQQRSFLFFTDPPSASRSTYGLNPFPESLEIARFLRENSDINDRIAVIGSEPQIYFYSNRRAATGYVYTYALMENHPFAKKMQHEMIREIESNNPKFLIFVNVFTSWLVRPDSDMTIFKWFDYYSWKYYKLVGGIDIGFDRTIYLWNQKLQGYSPRSPYWVTVYRRK